MPGVYGGTGATADWSIAAAVGLAMTRHGLRQLYMKGMVDLNFSRTPLVATSFAAETGCVASRAASMMRAVSLNRANSTRRLKHRNTTDPDRPLRSVWRYVCA